MWRDIVLFTPWLIVRAMKPFYPAGHPFKVYPPSFDEWCSNATPLAVQWGVVLTWSVVLDAVALSIVVLR